MVEWGKPDLSLDRKPEPLQFASNRVLQPSLADMAKGQILLEMAATWKTQATQHGGQRPFSPGFLPKCSLSCWSFGGHNSDLTHFLKNGPSTSSSGIPTHCSTAGAQSSALASQSGDGMLHQPHLSREGLCSRTVLSCLLYRFSIILSFLTVTHLCRGPRGFC